MWRQSLVYQFVIIVEYIQTLLYNIGNPYPFFLFFVGL